MCNEKCDPNAGYCNGVCVNIRMRGLDAGFHGVTIREYGLVDDNRDSQNGCGDHILGKIYDPEGVQHSLPDDDSNVPLPRKHGSMGNIRGNIDECLLSTYTRCDD